MSCELVSYVLLLCYSFLHSKAGTMLKIKASLTSIFAQGKMSTAQYQGFFQLESGSVLVAFFFAS